MTRAALIPLLLAACQPVPVAQTTPPPMRNEDAPIDLSAGICRAEAARRFVGRRATAALGADALKATGATTLRWAPPDAALTMDYRRDRLTITTNADTIVARVACG